MLSWLRVLVVALSRYDRLCSPHSKTFDPQLMRSELESTEMGLLCLELCEGCLCDSQKDILRSHEFWEVLNAHTCHINDMFADVVRWSVHKSSLSRLLRFSKALCPKWYFQKQVYANVCPRRPRVCLKQESRFSGLSLDPNSIFAGTIPFFLNFIDDKRWGPKWTKHKSMLWKTWAIARKFKHATCLPHVPDPLWRTSTCLSASKRQFRQR